MLKKLLKNITKPLEKYKFNLTKQRLFILLLVVLLGACCTGLFGISYYQEGLAMQQDDDVSQDALEPGTGQPANGWGGGSYLPGVPTPPTSFLPGVPTPPTSFLPGVPTPPTSFLPGVPTPPPSFLPGVPTPCGGQPPFQPYPPQPSYPQYPPSDGIPQSQIPPGDEDLYILKSQIVPPVCPKCPDVINRCSDNQKKCPPCPACARCPEPNFECKKVPNYHSSNMDLPMPLLNDFSQF